MQPEMIVHKIVRWGRRSGSITDRPTKLSSQPGYRFIKAVQRASGKKKNSGPSGTRRMRWYQGRFRSGYRKEA